MLLLLLSCVPVFIDHSEPTDTDTDAADSASSDTDTDTDTDTEPDTGVDTIDGEAEGRPVFSPDGGAFVGEVTVTLSSTVSEQSVSYCVARPDQVCTLEPYTEPITLDGSAVVHLQAGEFREARSFVEVDAEVLAFASDVPVMLFWTAQAEPDSDEEVAMGLDVFSADGGRTDFTSAPADSGRARLRLRGSSTFGLSKPSYDMELWAPDSSSDRASEMLGMPADGDWVLYAPYYFDEALIRNPLGYALSNAIGRYAPRTRSVELFVAEWGRSVDMDDYRGVYILTEEIERGADRVDIAAIDPDDDSEPEITGGYLFKRDRTGDGEYGFSAGLAGGRFSFDQNLVWVDPDETERTSAQEAYLAAVLDDFAWALAASDHTSPYTGLHYSEIIDVPSWIDHHILNVLFKNPDAFRLSGYLHKDREGLVASGPLWDLDRTAGASDGRATYPTWWDASNQTADTTYVFEHGWYDGLFDDPAFRAAYWSRWEELLAGDLSAASLDARIDTLAGELSEAGPRNASRWGTANFSGKVSDLKRWMRDRVEWIEACIEDNADPRDCTG